MLPPLLQGLILCPVLLHPHMISLVTMFKSLLSFNDHLWPSASNLLCPAQTPLLGSGPIESALNLTFLTKSCLITSYATWIKTLYSLCIPLTEGPIVPAMTYYSSHSRLCPFYPRSWVLIPKYMLGLFFPACLPGVLPSQPLGCTNPFLYPISRVIFLKLWICSCEVTFLLQTLQAPVTFRTEVKLLSLANKAHHNPMVRGSYSGITLTSSGNVEKLLNLSMPWFPSSENRDMNSTYMIRLLGGLNKEACKAAMAVPST